MATIGKWWGRTRLVYKASPAWTVAGTFARGPYVYEKVSGRWFGVFDGNGVNTSFFVRERYSLSNLAAINYSLVGYPAGEGLFAYSGFLYGIRRSVPFGASSIVLFKVNVSTGVVTDVKTIYSSSDISNCSMAFDGTQTVYFATSSAANALVNISKYDLVSDIVTSLRNEVTYIGNVHGAGVDASKVYWLIQYGSTQWYACSMTTAGASFSAESIVATETIQVGVLGYKGFYFFNRAGHVIKVPGGASFDVVRNSMSQVFVDDSQGIANSRFCTFGGGVALTAFHEFDGATQKTELSLAGHPPSSNMFVTALRPGDAIEEAATIVAHDTDYWWEAPSNMKETI